MAYEEDDYLAISGIQHFAFCRRQWALIHIEDQWADNILTFEGELLHERAHDGAIREKRGTILIVRGLKVSSRTHGMNGVCDIVEFHEDPQGVFLPREGKKYLPVPVEYKRGRAKPTNMDELQLAAQALCLEEMLCCHIGHGFIFYGEPKKREKVEITEELRAGVKNALLEMHDLFKKQQTPKVKPRKGCTSCSLADKCLPVLCKPKTVASYMNRYV